MTALFFILAGAVAFYVCLYRHWDYMKKFIFKTVLVYLLMGGTALMAVMFVMTVREVADMEQSKMPGSRLSRVEYEMQRGDYEWVAEYLLWDKDYEEEFSYLWERLTMYTGCNRYLVFRAASDAGLGDAYGEQADFFRALLAKLCADPAYEENEQYGAYFFDKAGLAEEAGR